MNLRVCLCSDPDNRMFFVPEDHDEACPEHWGPGQRQYSQEEIALHIRLARIEQKLDETIKALKSGAIGAWGNER